MFTTRPEIAGTFGVVATTHWVASAVGMSVLERGGNAFDAAVAAGFALQLLEPHLNGPGGDSSILIHDARADQQHEICGQGLSAADATIDAYAALGLDMVPGTGFLAATVPGAFGAWLLMLRHWGTWELADVLAPAIAYAKGGVPLVPRIPAAIERMRPLFEAEWPTSAAVFLPGGKPPAVEGLFANPAIGATYERIVRESSGAATREARIQAAHDAWYKGFVAEAIGRFFAAEPMLDTSGERHRGLLTADDLAPWTPPHGPPARYEYGRHTVLKCGPWSQGPVFLQQLALLKGFPLGDMDPLGADFVHTLAECKKLAYADREAFYGDPDTVQVPLETLLSDAYNNERRQEIGAPSQKLAPGAVKGFTTWVDHDAHTRSDYLSRAPGAGEPTVARLGASGGDTVHVDVIDRWGNMVAATPSGGWLQSSPVVPDLGFPLGTRGQMFSLRPGLPNSLAPRKRPRTTLSPSLSLRNGRAWMAFGTPGGEQQDQWSLIFFVRMVHHRLNIQQAIDMASFHSEHWPSSFWPRASRPNRLVLEGRFPAATVEELRAMGHEVEVGDDWSEGRLSAARLEDGILRAGANPRGMQGYAVGR